MSNRQVHDYVVHPETMGPKHCHADCPFLEHRGVGRAQCSQFSKAVFWDFRRKVHGNLRCPECLERVK